MDRRRYGLVGAAITAIVGGAVGYAVAMKGPLLAVISVVVGIPLLRAVRTRVDEPLVDERVERVAEKASRRTLEVIGVTGALLSAVLIAIGRDEGYILGFLICAALVLYMAFYTAYSRSEIS